VTTPVDTQVLAAVKALLVGQTDALSIDTHRTEADPYTTAQLPAINLLAVEESIATPTTIGMAQGGAAHQHRLQLVVQVITQGGSAAADQARLVSAQAAQAIGLQPTLSGLCATALLPMGKQWLHDDDADTRLVRQNNLWVCGYRTHSHDPFTAI
jgi:hypothetical protein